MRWRRGVPGAEPLDPQILAQLDLGKERVLASAPLIGGGGLALTAAGLRALTPRGEVLRRSWIDIDHMVWHPESSTLAVFWVGGRRPGAFEIDGDSSLPHVAHERWRASVLLTREVALGELGSAWLALRRDSDGALSVQSNLPPRVLPTDDRVQEALTRARAALLAEAGEADGAQGSEPLAPLR